MAVTNFASDNSNQRAKALSALTLAYVYYSLERNTLADKWFIEAIALQDPESLFEYQLFLKLKLERQQKSNSILTSETEKLISNMSKQILEVSKQTKIDIVLYSELILYLDSAIKKAE